MEADDGDEATPDAAAAAKFIAYGRRVRVGSESREGGSRDEIERSERSGTDGRETEFSSRIFMGALSLLTSIEGAWAERRGSEGLKKGSC